MCNTATTLTGFVAGASVGHTLQIGVCNTITGARIRSGGGCCGTLWRDSELADELVDHLVRCVPAGDKAHYALLGSAGSPDLK